MNKERIEGFYSKNEIIIVKEIMEGDNNESAKSLEYKKELDRTIVPFSFTCEKISINKNFKQSSYENKLSMLDDPKIIWYHKSFQIRRKHLWIKSQLMSTPRHRINSQELVPDMMEESGSQKMTFLFKSSSVFLGNESTKDSR
jgi:hypothetical protein